MKLWAACCFAALFVGCATPAPKDVRFSEAWPETTAPYSEVTKNWTRHGLLMSGYDKSLEVWATVKSPEWRRAYVARRAKLDGLGPAAHNALLAAEKKVSDARYEVHLRVTTYERNENNLHQGDKASWRVALVDDKGRRIEATRIRRDRRPVSVVRSFYRHVDDFAESYVAEFPKSANVLRTDATKLSLRVSSAQGAVRLTWRAAP